MPFAGLRIYNNTNVNDVGSSGYYWSSSPDDASYAYYLRFRSSTIFPQNANLRSLGFSVRCFKDVVQEFDVTFEPNNGETATTVQVEDGETINSEDIPSVTKTGYNFAGWFTSIDGGTTLSDTAFDFDTAITEDITLYAKWTDYVITFDTDGGSDVDSIFVNNGDIVTTRPRDPNKEGYMFL